MEALARKEIVNEYNQVPYESYPYPVAQIDNLYTVGKLFGLGPVNPKKCKVLELGCASGGNIIPMALQFPNSEFVGVDLSKVQIEKGQADVKALGLNNLSLKEISITDINKDFGEFDYIIAHGVISWVPLEVQDKIFEICSNNLSQKGVAYVSYNTLPGWNMIKSIREMILYHTDKFVDTTEKVKQAKLLLEFIRDSNEEAESPYRKLIDDELRMLRDIPDCYLIHDHMEKDNYQFYLHEFVEKASKTGLQYLGDAIVSTMFQGNFSEKTQAILRGASDDIVRSEQYMDFVRNRRFRSTLLCKKGNILSRNLNSSLMKEFCICEVGISQDKSLTDGKDGEEVSFSSARGVSFRTRDNLAITTAKVIEDHKYSNLRVTDLIEEVSKRLGKNYKKETLETTVCDIVLRLFLSGGIGLNSFPRKTVNKVSIKPKVSKLAAHQAQTALWCTSEKSDKIVLDIMSAYVLRYLDGNNTVEDVVAKIKEHIEAKEIIIWSNGVQLQSIEDKDLKIMVNNVLDGLVKNSLLIA